MKPAVRQDAVSLPPPQPLIPVPFSTPSAMAEADTAMGKDSKEAKSRLEDIKYYTSLFLGTLSIVCVFGFLFLVPFVLDPAISTLMHDFVENAVHCKVGTIIKISLLQ